MRVELKAWRRDYNSERPHSALGNLMPTAYMARIASLSQQAEALRSSEGFATRPVATRSLKGQSRKQETPVLST